LDTQLSERVGLMSVPEDLGIFQAVAESSFKLI
jgi:hypothetical protein